MYLMTSNSGEFDVPTSSAFETRLCHTLHAQSPKIGQCLYSLPPFSVTAQSTKGRCGSKVGRCLTAPQLTFMIVNCDTVCSVYRTR